MRITIAQGAFFPVPPILGGAVEKVWFALGKEFARRGHSVTHISRAMPQFPSREIIASVEHIRVNGFDQARSAAAIKALDLLYSLRVRRVLPAADILVTNTFWLPLLLRDASRGRTYVHVQRTPKGQMRWYSRAARLLAVSQAIADAIIAEAPQLARRVRVIPNPVPFELPANVETVREKTVLFVGRIHPEKGLEALLDACAQLPANASAWKLVIVGSHDTRFGGGGDAFRERLLRLAERSVLRVEWMGPIFDESELIRQYQGASIFIYPSASDAGEALPVAPLEAMAYGCPPLVSDLACFADYVEDDATGFMFSPNELSQRLAAIIAMPPQALRRVGQAAHARMRGFAIGPIADRYLADFESLIAPDA